jgi:cation diffusion facilitator CzcD-associated flavoprotein CzcO
VGYGKSSCDVVVGLSDAAASTTVVARELIWKLPKRLMDRLNYKYLFLTRMGEALIPYQELRGFERFLHGPGRRVRNAMLGSFSRPSPSSSACASAAPCPPGASSASPARPSASSPTASRAAGQRRDPAPARQRHRAPLVKDGKPTAELRSGEQVPADVVICGTGWTQDVPFLDAATKARIPRRPGNFRLYRCILPPGVPNLVFNGYNSSFFSPLSAEMGALWIASYLGGALRLPPVPEQLAVTDRRLRWMEERTEGKHARGTNIIPFSMHQIDELLGDMGLPVGPLQRFLEWQLPVRPGRYARVARALHRRLKPQPAVPELVALPAE